MNLSTIRLQFSEQASPYQEYGINHVDTILKGGMLLGARFDGGVRIRPANYTGFRHIVTIELRTTEDIAQAYYGAVAKEIGKKFDPTATLPFVNGRDWRKSDSWFSSELVAAMLEQCGYLPRLVTPCFRITPGTLLTVLSAVMGGSPCGSGLQEPNTGST